MTVRFASPVDGSLLTEKDGGLTDKSGNFFQVVAGIPRFCGSENYADNFGKQWNRFSRTQLDDPDSGLTFSERRFFAESGWSPESLDGLDILEVGSGAGRFSKVVLEKTAARLWSVDYSNAVDANLAENGAIAPDRFNLAQASIYELPFGDDSFDRIFCFGVLQHTPDVAKSVEALIAKAKPGGEIAVDFYARRHAFSTFNAKYLLRPLTRRVEHDRLLQLIDDNIDWLIRLFDTLNRFGIAALTRFLPLADLRLFPAGLNESERREWALLDTFDMFSPEYDQPQRIKDVAAMFERSGARVSFSGHVDVEGSPAVVRAIKL